MNRSYQLVGENTKKIYREANIPEDLYRWLQQKYPTPRTDKDRSTFAKNLFPEPMRIERKREAKKAETGLKIYKTAHSAQKDAITFISQNKQAIVGFLMDGKEKFGRVYAFKDEKMLLKESCRTSQFEDTVNEFKGYFPNAKVRLLEVQKGIAELKKD